MENTCRQGKGTKTKQKTRKDTSNENEKNNEKKHDINLKFEC